MRQCRKLVWVIVVSTAAWLNLKVFHVVEGKSTNTRNSTFSFRIAVLNHLEPQSSKTRLLLPIIPIDMSRTLLHFCGRTFVETAVFFSAPALRPLSPSVLALARSK